MDALRKLAMQYLSHKSMETNEFLLAAITELAPMDDREARALAELLLLGPMRVGEG